MTIAQAGTKGEEWQKGIGTGPFILQRYEPGVRALTKGNHQTFWDIFRGLAAHRKLSSIFGESGQALDSKAE
jgi:hypothetical protein